VLLKTSNFLCSATAHVQRVRHTGWEALSVLIWRNSQYEI